MNILKINLFFMVCMMYSLLSAYTTTSNDLFADDEEESSIQQTKPLTELNSPLFYLNNCGTLQFTATTKEYTLRSIQPEDLTTFIQFRADPKIMKFMAGGPQTEDSSKMRFDTLLNRIKNNNPMAWLALVNTKTNIVKGFVALGAPSFTKPGVAELIAFFNPDIQAQGLGSTLLDECLTTYAPEFKRLGQEGFVEFQCFTGASLHTVHATVHQDNTAALKILYKSKMIEVPKHTKLFSTLQAHNQEENKNSKTIYFEYILP